MAIVVHSYEQPDRFIAGTVGPPGQRTFYLQAKDGNRVTSVALEKQQVAILAERLDILLDEALRRSGGDAAIPAVAPVDLRDADPLEQPIVEEFRVGTITLSWDGEDGVVVIELFPVSEVAASSLDDDDDGGDSEGRTAEAAAEREVEAEEIEIEADEVLLVKLDPGYARFFARRAQRVVSAGRPPCQFCGGPIDPEGHLCPRANGFKRIAH